MQSISMQTIYARFLHLENRVHHQLVLHSITALRIALGLVFFGFGVLKYFPGVSPAQNLTEATTHILFFGLVPRRGRDQDDRHAGVLHRDLPAHRSLDAAGRLAAGV